eukprot:scaffold307656_cov24-Tisochrysis_lutea.AAC.1
MLACCSSSYRFLPPCFFSAFVTRRRRFCISCRAERRRERGADQRAPSGSVRSAARQAPACTTGEAPVAKLGPQSAPVARLGKEDARSVAARTAPYHSPCGALPKTGPRGRRPARRSSPSSGLLGDIRLMKLLLEPAHLHLTLVERANKLLRLSLLLLIHRLEVSVPGHRFGQAVALHCLRGAQRLCGAATVERARQVIELGGPHRGHAPRLTLPCPARFTVAPPAMLR